MSSQRIAQRLIAVGAATVHEAQGRRGSLGPSIGPIWRGAVVAAPCRTVALSVGDNLAAHIALESAAPGELVVAAAGNTPGSFGFWGAILTEYAIFQGVVGLVTNLAVRDVDAIERLNFPVFAPSTSVQGTVKRDVGRHQVMLAIGPSLVFPGDWIVADRDGCVVVRAHDVDEVIAAAERKAIREEQAIQAIRKGASTRTALELG